MIDVYESAVEQTGRWGVVFERDDDTAFLYLLDLSREGTNQIVEAFNAQAVTAMPADAPVYVQWNPTGDVAGLFVSGDLLALFDLVIEGQKGRWAMDTDKGHFSLH
jgi:hypothetical protein